MSIVGYQRRVLYCFFDKNNELVTRWGNFIPSDDDARVQIFGARAVKGAIEAREKSTGYKPNLPQLRKRKWRVNDRLKKSINRLVGRYPEIFNNMLEIENSHNIGLTFSFIKPYNLPVNNILSEVRKTCCGFYVTGHGYLIFEIPIIEQK